MSNRSTLKNLLRSSVCLLLVLVMTLSCGVMAFAVDENGTSEVSKADSSYNADQFLNSADSDETESYLTGFVRDNLYADYYDKHTAYDMALPTIKADGNAYTSASAGVKNKNNFEGESGVAVFNEGDKATFTFEVPQTGMYAVEFKYFPIKNENGNDIETELLIDGKFPFEESSIINLKRVWVNDLIDGELSKDTAGNELLPNQVQAPRWVTASARDAEGKYLDPYKYYLTAGTHTITLVSESGAFGLDYIKLYNEGSKLTYDEYISNAYANGATETDQVITNADGNPYIEAEQFTDKSDSIVQMAFDRSDSKNTPYSVTTTVYNTLGGTNWVTSGNRVNWSIEVPEDGLYEISFRYRQSYQRGKAVYRKLYIDDEIPFAEANNIKFDYQTGFQYMVAGRQTTSGEAENFKFYLTKGKHTLSLEASIGEFSSIYRNVEDLVYQLNYIYRKIVLITGISPDGNRDYELFARIPDLEEMLSTSLETVNSTKAYVDSLNDGKGGGDAEILTKLSLQLQDFIEMPYSIPGRLSGLKDNISTLGNWLLDIRDQPLCLDKIYIAGSEDQLPARTSNFIEGFSHEMRAFWSSFSGNYTGVGGQSKDARSLNVWVGTGRDQAIALKTLTDNYFTPQTGIAVNISLVSTGILSKAIIAGNGPNVALHVSGTESINLGLRGALVDLREMEGYDEVVSRFSKYAMVPYTLDTTLEDDTEYCKTFAIPETQAFNMMFYRTDIFAELGIKAPKTWDEFDAILPVIQSNNMDVGLGDVFYTLILQNNGSIYNKEGSRTNFGEQYAIDAFTKWTDYYKLYSFPLAFDFYTRFRNGEMPLAFAAYSQATFLDASVPELRGLWEMAPIPGTLNEKTGKINRMEQATGTASVIIKSAEKSKELKAQKEKDSWTFIDWWSSADIVAQYGRRVEMAVGPVARYTPVNIEAFGMIGWEHDHAVLIEEQRESVKEIPEIIGGYYVTRMVTNAFRAVTNNYSNPREMLAYYDEQINNEIWRKRAEYHFSVPEEDEF